MTAPLLADRHRGVLRLTLNRPDVRNAFNGDLIEALVAALEEARADDAVRVIVLGGAGASFCAGADLAWMKSLAARGAAQNGEDARHMAGLFGLVEGHDKPVIGRIHGAAIGGGVGLVAACDIPIAEAGTKFAFTEVRLGMAPAVISPFVVRRIGVGAARQLFVTGERFDAVEAHRIGLVNKVAHGEAALDSAVDEVASQIAKGGPRAVVACKRLARTVLGMAPAEATSHTAALIAELRASAEGQEGMRAFLTRDDPAWVKALDADGEGT
ncbi:MAG: enoyl-CoA hydratase/isomerase family protein [Deltaproteobacteria bacterium]|nr:enoyl-CoA hydratase/isomerase family protein [Deltaproteobacteria bacterium]